VPPPACCLEAEKDPLEQPCTPRRPPFLFPLLLSLPGSLPSSSRACLRAPSSAVASPRRYAPPRPPPSSPLAPPRRPLPPRPRNRPEKPRVAADRRRFPAGIRARRHEISRHRPVSGQADLTGVLRVSSWSFWAPSSSSSRAGASPSLVPGHCRHGHGCSGRAGQACL
jgi:hypothetical protein